MADVNVSNSFAPLSSGNNLLTGRWSGNSPGVDTYISGYCFVNFSYIPDAVLSNINTLSSGTASSPVDKTSVENVLESAFLSCTIPTGTLNVTEHTGLGGITWSNPTNITYDRTITMRFLETLGTPIYSIFKGWVRTIRDYRYGVSGLNNTVGNNYQKSNYAGAVYYWTTRPDCKTVETAFCITGLYPTKDPRDSFSGDRATNDKVEIDMDFTCDYIWDESWVYDYVNNYISSINPSSRSAVDGYGPSDAGA